MCIQKTNISSNKREDKAKIIEKLKIGDVIKMLLLRLFIIWMFLSK